MGKEQRNSRPGIIISIDSTAEQAEEIRIFYKQVVGRKHSDLKMGYIRIKSWKLLERNRVQGFAIKRMRTKDCRLFS